MRISFHFSLCKLLPNNFINAFSLRVLKPNYFFLKVALSNLKKNKLTACFLQVYPSPSWFKLQCHKQWVYWVHFNDANRCSKQPSIHWMKSPSMQKDSRRLMTYIKCVSFAWRWISDFRSQQNHIFHYVHPAERISLISLSSRAQSYHITHTK